MHSAALPCLALPRVTVKMNPNHPPLPPPRSSCVWCTAGVHQGMKVAQRSLRNVPSFSAVLLKALKSYAFAVQGVIMRGEREADPGFPLALAHAWDIARQRGRTLIGASVLSGDADALLPRYPLAPGQTKVSLPVPGPVAAFVPVSGCVRRRGAALSS